MGKSNKKSNVKVAAVAPDIPTKGKKGKRMPEAEVEIQPLPKKLKSATKVPQKKKHETSSSSEEASESEEEEVKLPVSKKPNLAKKIPANSSSEEDSSDEESAPKVAAAVKKGPKVAKNGSVLASRNGKAESSDGSESDSEEEKTQVMKPLQTKVAGKMSFFKGKPVEESSDDDESEDEASDEESEGEESDEQKTVQKVIKTQQPAKIVKKESSEEDSSDESDDEPKTKQQRVQASKIQQPSKVTKKQSTSEDSADESEEDEPVKKQSAKSVTPKTPKTSVTPGVKTLFVGNLSFSIDSDSIIEFFQDAGEVVDVRLATRDGSFRGYGHVEFATEEAAAKAMDKNGQDLLGRSVRLDFAAERGAPGSKQDKPRQEQKSGNTAFVRGFDKNQEEDDIRNSLEEHFGDCGSIENIRIPKDYESGTFKGFAYVEFKDNASLSKALELATDELSVEEAMASRSGGGRDGSGRRGGGRGFGGRGFGDGGGRFSGGRGRGGGGGRGTPRGRGRGDRNGGRGTPKFNMASSGSGKKTTFGDD